MRITLIFTSAFLILLITGCCKEVDYIIHDSSIMVDNRWVEFDNFPLLKRKCNSVSIRIELKHDWEPVPPWDSILINNKLLVKPEVVLVSDKEKQFRASILGLAGGMLNAKFEPEIPKDTYIKIVKIRFDKPVLCNQIIWHDFNLK